jgi:small subunit ribosomal protein S9
VDEYFKRPQDRNAVLAPLEHCGILDRVDVAIRASGGGITGQAGACMQGIARALMSFDSGLEDRLREKHFLTRDARMKERKKYGLHGARRGTQFSKR